MGKEYGVLGSTDKKVAIQASVISNMSLPKSKNTDINNQVLLKQGTNSQLS